MSASPERNTDSALYGYLTAGGLALGVAVSNGLARFAYALILPAMRTDLGWNYTQAGALNTANAIGYFAGSAIALASVRRLGPSRLFIGAMSLTAIAILAMGLTADFSVMIGLRTLAGVSGAVVFISGSVLAASVFPRHPARAAAAIAIYFAGGGVGLLLPGLTLPWLFAAGGDSAWPIAWIGMGLFAAVVTALTAAAANRVDAPPSQRTPHPWRKTPLLATFTAYACFALGYFAYMTFIVAWMREHGASAAEVTTVWAALGIVTIVSPRLWARPIASWSGGRPLAAVLLVVGAGALLPVLSAAFPIMVLSAVLYGSFFMVPAAITGFVKKALPPVVWGEAVAAFTLLFSVLQLIGPVVTGAVADRTGSLGWGLGVSAAVLVAGAFVALLQPEPRAP
jgi:predicted MFS family arabinose efflux permease